MRIHCSHTANFLDQEGVKQKCLTKGFLWNSGDKNDNLQRLWHRFYNINGRRFLLIVTSLACLQYQSKWRAKDQNATKVDKTNGRKPFPAVGKNEKVPLSLFRWWLTQSYQTSGCSPIICKTYMLYSVTVKV